MAEYLVGSHKLLSSLFTAFSQTTLGKNSGFDLRPMDSLDNSLVSMIKRLNKSDYLHIYLKTNKLTPFNIYFEVVGEYIDLLLFCSLDKFL